MIILQALLIVLILYFIFYFISGQLSPNEWGPVLKTKISNEAHENIDMLPKTKRLLKDFYLPFNKQMADFMGDKRYLFNQSD